MATQNNLVPRQCLGLWGKIFGHDFQPRFSTEETIHGPQEHIAEQAIDACETDTFLSGIIDSVAGLNKSQKVTYEGDVCGRCGFTITKQEHASDIRTA